MFKPFLNLVNIPTTQFLLFYRSSDRFIVKCFVFSGAGTFSSSIEKKKRIIDDVSSRVSKPGTSFVL